jgi:NADH dehydrogenase
MNIPVKNLPRVVIIGGGFGGMALAREIRDKNFQTVLLDKHNYHTFQPLLYQVATSGLEPDSIAYPLRKIFSSKKHFHFRVAEVEKVNTDEQIVNTNIGPIHYDYLVIATGTGTNFFGNEKIKKHAMPMKSVPEALNLRSLILENFEKALLTKDIEERTKLMNFVIVGGGPTGTELAGALAELKSHVLPNDYPDLDLRLMQIHLLEAGGSLLAGMSEKSAEKAEKYLEELGVQVWLNTMVKDFDGNIAQTSKGELESKTLIWAAGVQALPIDGINKDVLLKNGRYKVDEINRVVGYQNIFALGDVAAMQTDQYPNGHPQVAQPAIQQGEHLAKNLLKLQKGKNTTPFKYNDLGSMATVGRNRAVVDLNNFSLGGALAWFIWMFIHLIALVGFRNKMVTLINWTYAYVKYDKGARLIIRPFEKKKGHV